MTLSPQNRRVIKLAQQRGHNGFCAVDFLAPWVADGGSPITRLAARVAELKAMGYEFDDGGRRNGTKVYVLKQYSVRAAA